jgi:hypothetical protein
VNLHEGAGVATTSVLPHRNGVLLYSATNHLTARGSGTDRSARCSKIRVAALQLFAKNAVVIGEPFVREVNEACDG